MLVGISTFLLGLKGKTCPCCVCQPGIHSFRIKFRDDERFLSPFAPMLHGLLTRCPCTIVVNSNDITIPACRFHNLADKLRFSM